MNPPSKRPPFKILSANWVSSKVPKATKVGTQQEMKNYKEVISSQIISDLELGMDFQLAQNSRRYITLKTLALDFTAVTASKAFAKRVLSVIGDLTKACCNRAGVILESVILPFSD